jgi:histidine triad (HIT) family protein
MDDCIFCKIVKKEIPSLKIYENGVILAFLDISPINFGHTLIIPKVHFQDIHDTPTEILVEMIKTSKVIAKAVKATTKAEGINVTMNNEAASGQAVLHAHIHVIPRYSNDGYKLWGSDKKYSESEGKDLAQKITQAL